MSLDLIVGARVFSSLLDGHLNRTGFISKGYYLPSYSIDPSNTYYGGVYTAYDHTGYFVSVRKKDIIIIIIIMNEFTITFSLL
jgi:hypothetical protein